ncbi:hypothetical protein [Acidithiobacillus ferriphilus]|uniref:hypothetical protein n=1 Tax=Acidithiobacillus ferriphilus TaxID=1689834 RepID=UPI001C0732CE|nr:hypothetical protein [Acidithiobacillus ferriphilus]MBU2833361.1 hypothetical protein [Acidithiobacillus ferriphilus]
MWNWLRGRTEPVAPPSGVVIDAGIPAQDRVAELPLPEPLFILHYNGFGLLPENPELRQILLETARSGDFLRDMPRVSAQQLAARAGLRVRFGVDVDTVARFFRVLHAEITRRMYVEAARQREGAVGLRLTLLKPETATPEDQAIVNADTHGLGAGVYPFTHIPENPHPGTENPFIIRVVMKKDLV